MKEYEQNNIDDKKNLYLYKDAISEPSLRADCLLSQMTWEEKLAQMTGFVGWSGLDLEKDYPHGVGQIAFFEAMQAKSHEEVIDIQRKLQTIAMKNSRFGIPAIFHVETLCGTLLPGFTTLPSGIGQGATFDWELEQEAFSQVGLEARAAGATQAFSPVLDVSRDSRFGRQGETYGEDPTLIAKMGVAAVRGLQQDGDLKKGTIATAKHFLGYHGSEGGIHAAPCDINERLLQEIYAKPFHAAIREADMQGIMPCYSSIDGVPVAISEDILQGLLRDKLGFRGMIVSDYCAVSEVYDRHNVAESYEDAGRQAILAGMDHELPTPVCYTDNLAALCKTDSELAKAVDQSVYRILETKFRLGLFEKPFAESAEAIQHLTKEAEKNEIALRMALESMTLIKNDGILPLKKDYESIAVIGCHANSIQAMFGGYCYTSMVDGFLGAQNTMAGVAKEESGDAKNSAEEFEGDDRNKLKEYWPGSIVEKSHPNLEKVTKEMLKDAKTLVEAIQDRYPTCRVRYSFGYPHIGDDMSYFEDALSLAAESELVILTVGPRYSTGSTASMGEGIDGTDINLPLCQKRFIEEVSKLGKPIVLVHFGGRPISDDTADLYGNAILEAWNPAKKGADAITAVLSGDYNPAGRLPVTVAFNAGQIPIYYNHPNGASWHQNTISAFRSYVDCPHEPRYCFGHGLSYTDFAYSDFHLRDTVIPSDGELCAEVTVSNMGECDGDEVVQFYSVDRKASVVRPVKELVGFLRIHLAAGEKKTIQMTMQLSQIAFLDRNMQWKVEGGDMTIQVGASSEDIRLEEQYTIEGHSFVETGKREFYANMNVISTRLDLGSIDIP